MSKNAKTIFLLILLFIVWGIIGYKIYEHTKDTSIKVDAELSFKYKAPTLIRAKEYVLQLNYKDPFLPTKSVDIKKTVVKNAKRKYIRWPRLEYKGCIYRKKRRLGILNLGGNLEFVRQGDELKEIKIKIIYKDSIQLVYKDDKRVFKIKS